MMKIILVVLCILITMMNNVNAQSCANPLYLSGTCSGSYCGLAILTSPANRDDTTGICPNIQSGQSSCCGQAVYSAISTAWGTLFTDLQGSVTSLQTLFNTEIGEYINALNTISNNIGQYVTNPAWQGPFQTYINAIVTTTETFLDDAGSDWGSCAGGLANYFAGLFCFACEVNWSTYVSSDGSGGYIVTFSSDTCVQLSKQCINFFEDIVNYDTALTTAAQTFASQIGEGDTSGVLPTATFGFASCNGDCDTYICNNFVYGLNYVAAFNSLSRDVRMDRSVITTLNEIRIGEDKKLGDLTMELFKNVKKGIDQVTSVTKELNVRAVELRASTVTNQYNSTGYPVYDNGQNSGLDTNIGGGASVLFNWIRYLF